ncbi:hypothetical protein [Alsobacter sp. R-9]
MAPATLDTARWKFRRFMIDRRQLERWETWCRDVLRPRVEADGPAPAGHDPGLSDASPAAFLVAGRPTAYSKRSHIDRPRAPQTRNPQAPHPLKLSADGREALLDHLAAHWKDLREIAAPYGDDEMTLLRIANAHRATLERGEGKAWQDWVAFLRELQAG